MAIKTDGLVYAKSSGWHTWLKLYLPMYVRVFLAAVPPEYHLSGNHLTTPDLTRACREVHRINIAQDEKFINTGNAGLHRKSGKLIIPGINRL